MKKVALFLIGFIGCSCALFSGLYKIDVYRMENNLPVVFSVWRTDYTPQTGNQTEQPESFKQNTTLQQIELKNTKNIKKEPQTLKNNKQHKLN